MLYMRNLASLIVYFMVFTAICGCERQTASVSQVLQRVVTRYAGITNRHKVCVNLCGCVSGTRVPTLADSSVLGGGGIYGTHSVSTKRIYHMLVPFMLGSLIGLSSTPPVRLATCEVLTPTTVQNDNGPTTIGVYSLHVRFADTTSQPISRVTFTLDDGSQVSDVGTFSPGVAINHALGLSSTKASTCAVTVVTFKNGTTWNAN
jgi:hypothetical protein